MTYGTSLKAGLTQPLRGRVPAGQVTAVAGGAVTI